MKQDAIIKNGPRTLSAEELDAVSGGFWNIIAAAAIIAIGFIAEGLRNKTDPDALRREGMGN